MGIVAHPQGEQVFQTEGRDYRQLIISFQPHSHGEHRADEPDQGVGAAGQRRIGLAEFAFKPKVHPGLIAHL
eukprot:gene37701-biopygen29626